MLLLGDALFVFLCPLSISTYSLKFLVLKQMLPIPTSRPAILSGSGSWPCFHWAVQHRGRSWSCKIGFWLASHGEFCYREMCAVKWLCCKNCNKCGIIINCLVNSGKWAVEHKYETLEMKPAQVASKRCLAEASKVPRFRGRRMPSMQMKSSFLEHYVYLDNTFFWLPFCCYLSPTHFKLYWCSCFQNIRPVFRNSLSLCFKCVCFFFTSAGNFDTGKEIVLQISD